jgi:anaerobic ribonucleoside-triphosphate reductase
MVRTICENYRLPYFTFTPSFSVCANHGYLNGEQHTCPTCHEPAEVYSRVVGYLRSVSQWNEGKRAEFDMREHYRR